MTVRTPIARNSSNRFDRPGLTVSLSSMRPCTRPFERIARGVAPAPAIDSDSATTSAGSPPSRPAPIASTAPLRTWPPSARVMPLVRVSAVNASTSTIVASSCWKPTSSALPPGAPSSPSRVRASSTIERPSGVSSRIDDTSAAVRAWTSVTPGAATIRDANRLPNVMVPVLSSRITSTSPDASTARPLIASTLNRATRSMPAIPIADSRPPIVVGMRQTSRATSSTIPTVSPAKTPNGRRVTTASRKTTVRPLSRIDSAISFGVR